MLDFLSKIGDAISGVGAIVAVLAALYISNKTREDIQRDRDLRTLPVLAFQPGGQLVRLAERKFHHRIGGLNPAFIESAFREIPATANVLDFKDGENGLLRSYGELVNHGQGPAFDVHVIWIVENLFIASDEFAIDQKQQNSPRFCEGTNDMPSHPTHIAPGAKACLPRLPTFYILDVKRVISSVEGKVFIRYRDLIGRSLETVQKFRISSDVEDGEPFCVILFNDVVRLPRLLMSSKDEPAKESRTQLRWLPWRSKER